MLFDTVVEIDARLQLSTPCHIQIRSFGSAESQEVEQKGTLFFAWVDTLLFTWVGLDPERTRHRNHFKIDASHLAPLESQNKE